MKKLIGFLSSKAKQACAFAGLTALTVVTSANAAGVELPEVDLSSVTTWIVGIGATIVLIAATIFGIRKASGFLGR